MIISDHGAGPAEIMRGGHRCGPLRAGPPVDQRFKLLSYLHVQLHDTHVALTLAAILGSDREATVFLRVVENREQLGSGIDTS
jgi:hypothetical protein